MGKLKLQVHMSLDGMVAAQGGGHVRFNWDAELRRFSMENLADAGAILLGRKTAEGFIPHWKAVAENPNDNDLEIGRRITEIPKVVFSQSLVKPEWPNATIESGEIVDAVNRLKKQTRGDLIVYGGSSFVASLIEHKLVDQYYLLVNPIALGCGAAIFSGLTESLSLKLVTSRTFSCGTVLLQYQPADA